MDLGRVDAAQQPEEQRAGVEVGIVVARRSAPILGQRRRSGLPRLAEAAQRSLDLAIAGVDLVVIDVVKLDGLPQREEVLGTIVAGERLLDRLDGRLAPHVAHLGECGRVDERLQRRPARSTNSAATSTTIRSGCSATSADERLVFGQHTGLVAAAVRGRRHAVRVAGAASPPSHRASPMWNSRATSASVSPPRS